MTRTYETVDADGHILEPLTMWDDYIDPAFRERRPRFVIDDNGKERISVEGMLLGNPRGIGSLGSIGVRQGDVKVNTLKYAEGRKGGFDPHARIVDMDADGIDAAFLYPSLGLFTGAVETPDLAAAMCRAYNRWLTDYCKPFPDRLFGVAMLPMQSVEGAMAEMRFARETLGMRGGFLRPNPYHGKKMLSENRTTSRSGTWPKSSISPSASTRARPTPCRPSVSIASKTIARRAIWSPTPWR